MHRSSHAIEQGLELKKLGMRVPGMPRERRGQVKAEGRSSGDRGGEPAF